MTNSFLSLPHARIENERVMNVDGKEAVAGSSVHGSGR